MLEIACAVSVVVVVVGRLWGGRPVFVIAIFVAAMSFKNFMIFGFAYFINNWIADYGPRRCWIIGDGLADLYFDGRSRRSDRDQVRSDHCTIPP